MCISKTVGRRVFFRLLFILLFFSSLCAAQASDHSSAEIERRVDSILGQMTIEEKIDLLGGINVFDVRGVPRLGVPLAATADGRIGVRNDGPATVMAGGILMVRRSGEL